VSVEPLAERLRRQIREQGPMTFAEFMAAALYDAREGYYRSGRATIGREGDFFTSVSVGPLFGRLLAWRFAELWEELGRPTKFTLVEQGAHDGTLAADILDGMRAESPECWRASEYVIVEPAPPWREQQKSRLAEMGKVRWVAELAELEPVEGVLLSNELLDALPVHRVRWNGAAWEELEVALKGEAFAWQARPLSSNQLAARLAKLGGPFPAGYQTEVNLEMEGWIAATARALARGWVLAIDYGYERDEYYRPERAHGTLSAYAGHARVENPLERPGEVDLTAHVDFTTLTEHAERAGLTLAEFTDQHRFLTAIGARFFAERAPQPKELRAFKTLMHPELLGAAFKVVCSGKNVTPRDQR
jgi:SAM-dependent MidA family methyltransferase